MISKIYLKEKYESLKSDMELCLSILDEDGKLEISDEDAKRVLPNIKDKADSIIIELSKCYRK